jgi:hypothetical protein
MAYETIIVAYEDAGAANDAVRALRRLGIPASDIRRHPVDPKGIEDVAAAPEIHAPETGFWAWLFGPELEGAQLAIYRRALDRGGTILSVRVMEDTAAEVRAVLDRFGPLDLKETEQAL